MIVLLYSALTALFSVLGGFALAKYSRNKSQNIAGFLISAGAGMLLALAVFELLPHSLGEGLWPSFAYIFLGVLIVLIADKFVSPVLLPKIPFLKFLSDCKQECTHETHTHNHKRGLGGVSFTVACSSIGCILVCAFFDGLEMAAGFGMGNQTGWLLTSGILLHALPEGALVASMGLSGGLSQKSLYMSVLTVGFSFFLGSVVSVTLSQFFEFSHTILPVATGILITLLFNHLIPNALRAKKGLMFMILGFSLLSLFINFV